MLLGIVHVHSKGIIHRDVKPENFLVADGTVKLCDFGMAEFMPAKKLLGGVYGTPPYMSPEMILRRGYDLGSDVWSYGVCMYLLQYGEYPYVPHVRTGTAMKELIAKGVPEPKFISKDALQLPRNECREFIRCMLNRDRKCRPSAETMLTHPFLAREVAVDVECDMKKVEAARDEAKTFSEQSIDPIMQREITDLLADLRTNWKRSFSAADASTDTSAFTDFLANRRSTKSNTHTGTISIDPSVFKKHFAIDIDDGPADDDISTCDILWSKVSKEVPLPRIL